MGIRLGFSTGCLYKSIADEKDRLSFLRDSGQSVVELGLVKLNVFEREITRIGWNDLSGFDYVSLHAPVAEYGYNVQTDLIFIKIARVHRIRPFDLVVFHPDTVEDFSVFETCPSFPVAFENMDKRKKTFKSVEDIAELAGQFEDFKMVLDVNHAYTNDPSITLTAEFYEKLGDKIAQVHLSGYTGYHEPLFQTQQAEIIKSIRDPNVPIIVEGVLKPEELIVERDYILKILGED
ncbi:MAG: hypothetical protein HYX20_02410 [Candidatus Yanofskybacteria bacterium]|nr:hypothetical protein [Candidatus Yanofskybacteria bacterium]